MIVRGEKLSIKLITGSLVYGSQKSIKFCFVVKKTVLSILMSPLLLLKCEILGTVSNTLVLLEQIYKADQFFFNLNTFKKIYQIPT